MAQEVRPGVEVESAQRAALEERRALFDGMVSEARALTEQGALRSAAALLASAARFAWQSPPGFYASRDLEEVAAEIGRALPPPGPGPQGFVEVIHIISQTSSVGGHTRLVWRWIENDPQHVHSVILTDQLVPQAPAQLRDAVRASGGRFQSAALADNLVRVAARLRRLVAGRHAVLVLHVHPDDVVPVIALQGLSVPVIFLNHADHVFWVGGSVASVVAEIRPAGRELSIKERGIPEARSLTLPIPLTPAGRVIEREEARRRLGVAEDAVLIISIASSYKYATESVERHFARMHAALLDTLPNAVMRVVGPGPEGEWRRAERMTGGRLRALGPRNDIDVFYAAADIYVDSFPLASLTSILEAALRGLPAAAFSGENVGALLSSDDVALPVGTVQFSTQEAYLSRLRHLVQDPRLRETFGQELAESVARHHLLPSWSEQLAEVYSGAIAQAVRPASQDWSPPPRRSSLTPAEATTLEQHTRSGLSEPLWACRLRDARRLALPQRLRLIRSGPRSQLGRVPRFLVPAVVLRAGKCLLVALQPSRRGPART